MLPVVLVLIRRCCRLAVELNVLGGSRGVVLGAAFRVGVELAKGAGDDDLDDVARAVLDTRFMLSVELFGVTVPSTAPAFARTTRPLRIWR